MRRTPRAALAALLLVALLSAQPGSAAEPEAPADRVASLRAARPVAVPLPSPRAALATAGRVLDGSARATDPSATVALRDLWLARPELGGPDAAAAEALLARPTDGATDPYANGYSVPSASACGVHTCVHYVTSTADAAPSLDWVNLALATVEQTYEREVTELGYRAPLADGTRGGDARVDVYLKDLGPGLYGYCAAENREKGRTASGFCVLDNDYAPAQFPTTTTPEANLAVTAAHELFHAVQYAYDVGEDPWMMESTATWMEERVADDIDDNRQFLQYSQLQAPFIPLDAFSSTYSFQYGNWIFWEYLTQRFGKRVVRAVWDAAATSGGRYSLEALDTVLRRHGGLAGVYAEYAAANTVPALTYPEGAAYTAATPLAEPTLDEATPRHAATVRLDHLSADSVRYRPGAELGDAGWRLRVRVRAPDRRTAPAVGLLVQALDGTVTTRTLALDGRGRGHATVPFSLASVGAVTVSLVNTSLRMRCRRGTSFACAGRPRDDEQRFRVAAQLLPR